MNFHIVCIYTDNAPRLASFYETLFRETPVVEGSHYGFPKARLAVYDPGNVTVAEHKTMSVIFTAEDVMAEYHRLRKTLPELRVTSPPKSRPWGAYSFWFLDPDGNTVSLLERKGEAVLPSQADA